MQRQKSIWQDACNARLSYPQLSKDIQVDVVIIGAGITGVTAALPLIQAGKNVAIIEAKRVASGTTGYSTANLYVPIQPSYRLIKFKFGMQKMQAVIASRLAAIDFIEKNTQAYQLPCHFMRRPVYLFATNSKKAKFIAKEVQTLKAAGIKVEDNVVLPLPIKVIKAVRLPNQARFNPYLYVQALAKMLQQQGLQIYEQTAVKSVVDKHSHVQVTTEHGNIVAQKAIIATHLPIGIHKSQFLAYPYRSYAIAFTLKNDIYPNGHFWEIDQPHYSFSTHNIFHDNLDYMVVAGHSHKIGHPKEPVHAGHYATLAMHIKQYLPVQEIKYQWSAQHYQTADSLPFIGLASRTNKNIYIGTGYHADGLVYGTVAGMIISDLILGKQNPYAALYSPNRLTIFASLLRFIKENMRVTGDYVFGYLHYAWKKLFTRKQLPLQPGEGKILKYNGKLCAAYCDPAHKMHMVSAICTHMACPLKFNDAEKSWDCPCHGSRFDVDGSIIEGPATKPLARFN